MTSEETQRSETYCDCRTEEAMECGQGLYDISCDVGDAPQRKICSLRY